jgi:ribosomal protein S18 acetylase RimI-like enzyme
MTDPSDLDFDCDFRRAVPTDHDELHRLISKCWRELYSPHVSKDAIDRFLADDPVGLHLDMLLPWTEVAVIGNKIVGVVTVADDWVLSLFVAKRFRGNGIGTCLLHNAVIAGGRRLEVAAFNAQAIAFYERRGFQTVGEAFEEIGGTSAPAFRLRFLDSDDRHDQIRC